MSHPLPLARPIPSPLAWTEGVDHVLVSDGIPLHFLTGPIVEGAGTTLFVHGLTAAARTWDPVLPAFTAETNVVAVDLRGHGASGWATWIEGGYDLDSFASDLENLITHLGVGAVDYVGHSLGAKIGIVLAGKRPDLVRSLALSDTLPEIPRAGAEYVRDVIAARSGERGYRSPEDAAGQLEKDHPGWVDGHYENFVSAAMSVNWAGRVEYIADPQMYWITAGRRSREATPYAWEMAKKIECPTLIMWGSQSKLMDQDIVDRMVAAVPHSEVAVFETDHYIFREDPDSWVEQLHEFHRKSRP